jgi:predicted O-methyltransferase YrrM
MLVIEEKIGQPAMSVENQHFLLNEIVRRFRPNFYLEVGVWVGHSLMAAAYGNEDTACVGIENYSAHPDKDRLRKTFEDFNPMNSWVSQGDFIDVIPKLVTLKGHVGVYYYDGDHSHTGTLLGLYMALPLMAPHSYIIIDDLTLPQVKHAKDRFVNANAEWEEVMCIIPEREEKVENTYRNWYNGFCILERK